MSDNRVLPVLHLVSPEQVVEQANLVYEANADGLFLIDMGGSSVRTDEAVALVRSTWPDAWLGVNLLGLDVVEAIQWTSEWPIQGLWVDHTRIDEDPRSWQVLPRIRDALFSRAVLHPDTEFEVFGGVAFKYGREIAPTDYEKVARVASAIPGITATTSGPGTGEPADLAKLAAMRRGVGPERRLAVASGVTPLNAKEQFEHVDDVLLATGIEREFGYIDPDLLCRVLAAR